MVRQIAAPIIGYIVMAVIIVVSFTAMQFGLGTERVFKPGVYEASTFFIVLALVVSVVAAVVGGFVCALVARTATPHKVLALIVLVLGLILAVMNIDAPPAGPRPADVTPFQAAQHGTQPLWYSFTIPFIGLAGVLAGGSLKKRS